MLVDFFLLRATATYTKFVLAFPFMDKLGRVSAVRPLTPLGPPWLKYLDSFVVLRPHFVR